MKISQVLIAKNEEKNIERCLSHLKGVVNEQIVVDTGSTDETVEIAKKLGAKTYYFQWIDDFATAKNYAIKKAKGDWIIFLDCDEYFSDESIDGIKKTITKVNKNGNIDGINCELINLRKDGSVISSVKNISPRIFRNKKNIIFVNKIHEKLINKEKEKKKENFLLADATESLKIMHTGYDATEMIERSKSERNINILLGVLKDNMEDSLTNFYVGESYGIGGLDNQKLAIEYFYKAIEYVKTARDEELGLRERSYANILTCMIHSGEPYEKIKEAFEQASKVCTEYPDIYYNMGRLEFFNNKYIEAKYCFEKCIEYSNSYNKPYESKALGNIADIYENLYRVSLNLGDRQEVTKLAVALLKTEKYDFEKLCVLMTNLLMEEKEDIVIKFFENLYDYENLRDKVYLQRASKQCNNEIMVSYYKSLLNDEELDAVEASWGEEL